MWNKHIEKNICKTMYMFSNTKIRPDSAYVGLLGQKHILLSKKNKHRHCLRFTTALIAHQKSITITSKVTFPSSKYISKVITSYKQHTLFLHFVQCGVCQIFRELLIWLDELIHLSQFFFHFFQALLFGCCRIHGMSISTFNAKDLNGRLQRDG